MCDPLTITAVAVGSALAIGSSTTAIVGQNQAVKRQNQYSLAQAKAARDQQIRTAEVANQEAQRAADQNNTRLQEEERLAAQQAQRNQREGAQARSTLQTSAGENNVSGVAINALLADFYRQEANNNSSITQNILFKRNQTNFENESAYLRAQNTNKGMVAPLPFFQQGQGALSSAFQIGSSAVSGGLGGFNAAQGYQDFKTSKGIN